MLIALLFQHVYGVQGLLSSASSDQSLYFSTSMPCESFPRSERGQERHSTCLADESLAAQASRSCPPGRLPRCRTVLGRHRFPEPRSCQHSPAGDPRARNDVSRFRYRQLCPAVHLAAPSYANCIVMRWSFAFSSVTFRPLAHHVLLHLSISSTLSLPVLLPRVSLRCSPRHTTSTHSLWTSPPEASSNCFLFVPSVLSTECRPPCTTLFSCSLCVGLLSSMYVVILLQIPTLPPVEQELHRSS